MIQRLIRFLLGYVSVEIKGLMPEKCVNIMLARGVPVWNIRRTGACLMRASVAYGALGLARDAARASGCELVEGRRRGVPQVLGRLWRRKALILGCLIIIAGTVMTTRIIWTVDIVGEHRTEEDEIRRVLAENGVRQGVWAPAIDREAVERKLLLSIPDIAWAGLQIDGVNATLKVVETVPVPQMEDMDQPRDIIASRDGLIEQMIVLEGAAQVKEGDYVAKGQLLVTGTIYHEENDITRHVHSMAQVWIRTYYTDECMIPPQKSGLTPTGEQCSVVYLTHEGKEHRIIGKAPEYRLSAIEDVSVGPAVFGWRLSVRRYREMEREKRDPAEWTEVVKEAERETYEAVLGKIPAGVKVIDKTTRYDMINDGGVRLSVWVQVLEDIALPVNTGG